MAVYGQVAAQIYGKQNPKPYPKPPRIKKDERMKTVRLTLMERLLGVVFAEDIKERGDDYRGESPLVADVNLNGALTHFYAWRISNGWMLQRSDSNTYNNPSGQPQVRFYPDIEELSKGIITLEVSSRLTQ